MKKIILSLIICLLAFYVNAQEKTEFLTKVSELKGISKIEKLESKNYKEKYVMYIQQNVDGTTSEKGVFNQRIIVNFRGFDRPTVLVTEGYTGNYALNPRYTDELAEMFEANVIVCEYRYFDQSCPEPLDWQYMTVKNSCNDLHNIRQTFGTLFKNKWISTGISKGGSTCTYYRALFPDDVDVSVAYVAPISHALEDGRHEKFLDKKVGTKDERAKVKDCQQELMKRKEHLVNMLDTFANNRNYKFYCPLNEVFDYMVLEYEFSLWQWGTPVSTIPSKGDNDIAWFNYIIEIVEPSYFAYPSQYLPFFYQALRELGYYGYSLKYIKKYATIKDTRNYAKKIMVPEEMRNVEFEPELYKFTEKYLKTNDPQHIFIYGENDPWTASGVANWLNCKKKNNMKVYVQPRGSHLARIKNMPDNMREEITNKLKTWLN